MKPAFFDICLKQGITLGVAESVTGGLFSRLITKYPKASKIFPLGIISYSDNSKVEILNIDQDILTTYGAVSKEVAEAMAIAILDISHATIGIAFSGYAGPTADNDQPVGKVFTAFATNDTVVVFEDYFTGTRNQIQKQVVTKADNRLVQFIQVLKQP